MSAARHALLALLALVAIAPTGAAREIIESYDSVIDVAADGTLTVTETIAVVAEGKQIKRGIYRDFPTAYTNRWGAKVVVPFDLRRVERDGRVEPVHLEMIDGGVRIYIGNASRPVDPGPHTYTLRYTTRRQLGFFEDHDELYWNVTGNFWAFPIESASAVIRLPAGIDPGGIGHSGYTGPVGSKRQELRSWVEPGTSEVHFETTAALPRGHGLTVVASFPKGHVAPPSEAEVRRALYDANQAVAVGACGALAVGAYYLLAWLLVGRDPTRGTVIPRFEPPPHMSPACMRHLMRMGYDDACFATALVSMAVKGFLRIEENGGRHTLVRLGTDDSALSAGEKRIASQLLTGERFVLTQTHHERIRKAIERFKEWLVLENEGELFKANRSWLVPGVALSIVAVVVAGTSGTHEASAGVLFLLVWLAAWTAGVAAMLTQIVRLWTVARRSSSGVQRITSHIGAVFMTVFCLPFLGGEVMGLFMLSKATSFWMAPILVGLIGMNALFYWLLKRPTLAGRRLMDEIEGFGMYLRTAEGDEIRRLKAPEPTPELFERYLPFALALGLENEWSEHFIDVLERAGTAGASGYSPDWYHGTAFHRGGLAALPASLGSSLAGAVASSSSAPGSSSGSGGGGSSGGGGGGGGGGGW